MLLASGSALGQESGVLREELDMMKHKLEHLEKTVEQQAGPAVKEGNEKQWYEKIDVGFGATGVLQGSSGAKERLSSEGDVSDGSMSFDLELTAPVGKHGKFFTHFEAGEGDGIDGDISILSGFNDDADNEHNVRLTEIWYENAWFGELLRFRSGKIDLSMDFDTNSLANSETDQFLSSGFVNSLAAEFPDDNGLGAMLWFSPHEILSIGAGVADADGDWENVFDNVFSILELDFKPKIGGRKGNYRLYGWLNDKDHQNLKDPTETRERNYGFGISLDQQITEIVTLFGRYGTQRELVSQIGQAWSAGLQFSGKLFNRDDDAFGLAYGEAVIGEHQKDLDLAGGINSGNEQHVEFYYNWKINDNLNISPDIQWVKNANGDKANDDIWAFALRAQLSF